MSFSLDLTYPFYQGTGTTSDIPEVWDVALNGRGYMLDHAHPTFGAPATSLSQVGHGTIPLIRQQADASREPGEATINPEDLWPRSQSSWHKGAGQAYLDGPDSDRSRFRSSHGLDPWTRGKLQLLPTTSSLRSSANANLQVLRVDNYLYLADGNDVLHSTTPFTTFTSAVIHNGEAAQSVKSITTDGYTVYAALGSNGIHSTVKGAVTSSHFSDLSATLIGYAKGRILAANGNAIFNVTAAGVAPPALFTHPNTDFRWVGFAEGQSMILAAGYSGDKSLIYRTAVKADGTALDVPVVAGELPDGEIVRSIQGYLGFVIVGTDLGLRIAIQDTAGNLTFGALVRTDTSVRAFEPQDRFVWFGWENYDSVRTGLGRIDLTITTDAGAPGYATDLMASTQGQVTSVATAPNNRRVFTVAGAGLFTESDALVSSGTLDSGQISYGITDEKIALRLNMKHKPLPAGGSVTVYVEADDTELSYIGTSAVEGTTAPDERFTVPELSAQLYEIHVILAGEATLESYDFRAYPASERGTWIFVPLQLFEQVTTATGEQVPLDVKYERQLIESYVGTNRLISYQELTDTYSVFVEETNFQRFTATENRQTWNGTLVLKLKVLGE